ncbi:oxidoreductase [Virgibacillus phasianinus]|uniref:Oxidoreductase n=1 Tax=Virgibacillus phasianinus TaxID=2017483 RepID=A0A220U583_9BACI|nr:aldo/keto reductase [Virgibacillus phasianinus]ASK63277.1 oxidoreductase [Virgibacillus phasianinus]
MNTNRLGKSDLYVSELTLGCMSLGTDSAKAKEIIDAALDAGVNHLDTADLYDFGKNEEIVGEAIKNRRKDIVLTSKVGNHFDRAKKDWYWDPSKSHIKNGLKDSLRRLQTDYLDFYMLHGGTIDDPIDETISAFDELKQEGVIRAYGISSIRPNVIREYVKRSSIDGVMMQYNLLDRRPEEEVLDLLERHQISVLARGPLAKGMLTENGNQQIEKKAQNGFLDYSHQELVTIYQELSATVNDSLISNAAFQYILHHPAVKSAVFGASSVEQVKHNAASNNAKTMPDELYPALQAITKPIKYDKHR